MCECSNFSSTFRPAIERAITTRPSTRPDPKSPILKLNSNENPYPPSPRALAALRSIDGATLYRYPDADADEFRQAVSDDLGVPPDWILVTNGGDALLDLLVRACCDRDRPLAFLEPTYPLYERLAPLQAAPTIAVPFFPNPEAASPLPIAQLTERRAALTIVANPNSPTGHTAGLEELRQLADRVTGILAIDEAYIDFQNFPCGGESAIALTRDCDRVIVLRTLSKSYGLAGLRLGFAIANPMLLAGLRKIRPTYDIDAISARVGAAAVRDRAYKDARVQSICQTRSQFGAALRDRGFTIWPSGGNFLLVRPPSSAQPNAKSLHDALRARDIWVRHYDRPGLNDKLRVTIGTDAQMRKVLAAIDNVRDAA